MRTRSRFQSYFPILYYSGELAVIFMSTEIMLFLTYTPWSILNTIFIIFWFIFSISSYSHVLGRGIKNSKLVLSTFKTLFFFSGSVAILNMLFFNLQFQFITITIAIAIFYFLNLSYKLFVNFILGRYRAYGGNIMKCMIIGMNSHGIDLYNEILNYPEFGYRASGIFSFKKHPSKKNVNFPYLGKLKDMSSDIYKDFDVMFFSEKLPIKIQSFLLARADEYNLKANVIPELVDHDVNNFFIKKIESVPYININKLPLDGLINQFIKRSFDIVFSIFAILFFLSWMIPIFGLIIKLSSKGPIFFTQKREGYKGSYFNCLKFRTMVLNSDADSVWAGDDDPRLTVFGKFLRLSSLDEMPQFINVLLGDMSVVGPRPHAVQLNEEFEKKILSYNKRHRFKPGITGLAQSKGYNGLVSKTSQMRDRVKMDIFYFKNWSIFLDLKISFLTMLILIKHPLKMILNKRQL